MSNDSAPPMPLVERPITFAYDYRMRCAADHFTSVSAEVFQAQWSIEDGSVPCDICERAIAVRNENIDLRDPEDPALSRENVSSLVWYHTSTHADWPPPDYAEKVATSIAPLRAVQPADVFAENLHREQTKALHVGTYESTIENMFRRKRNQDDADSQFYMHRVALRINADEIDPNIRHESHDEASQLTVDDLGDWKAVRYLNVEESPGSISIAINPSLIVAVQTISLPAAPALQLNPEPEIVRLADQLGEKLQHIDAELDTLPTYDIVTSISLRRAGDPQALRSRELMGKSGDIWRTFTREMTAAYLTGVNPIVQEQFIAVLGYVDNETLSSFHDRFREEAAVIVNGHKVTEALAGQPWQPRHL